MSFLDELRRRNVFRTAIAYLAAAWLILQIADTVLPNIGAPAWLMSGLIYASVIALPFVLLISWKYELTPEGFRPTERDSGRPAKRYRHFDLVVYTMMTVAIVVLVIDNYVLDRPARPVDQSIAVLPLVSLSTRPEDMSFTGGIHDEILSSLARISALKVISRTSVLPYRDSQKNIREIAEELSVTNILEGSVRRAADTIRIDVKLINARSDEQIWSETYDRKISAANVFAIQSEIARAVASSLKAELTTLEVDRLGAVPTNNLEAYEFYLSGMDRMSELHNRNSVRLALSQFERAVEADPSFSLAWTGYADAKFWLHLLTGEAGSLQAAETAVARAEELDPGLPEIEVIKGRMAIYEPDHAAAIAHLSTAEQSLSGTASLHATRGRAYQVALELDNAISSYERAVELSPRDPLIRMRLARTYAKHRQYDMAEQHASKAVDFNPDCWNCRWTLGMMRFFRGDDAAAVLSAIDKSGSNEEDSLGNHREFTLRYNVAWLNRDYERARALLKKLEQYPEFGFSSVWRRFELAFIRALDEGVDASTDDFQQLLAETEKQLEKSPADVNLLAIVGQLHAWLGNEEDAVRVATKLMEPYEGFRFWYDEETLMPAMFDILLVAKRTDRFLTELDKYLAGPGSFSIRMLMRDPRLDYLRDNPRFKAIAEKYTHD